MSVQLPRQCLTQIVRLFFAVQLPVIQPLFYSPSLSSSSRIFQSSFSSFPIRFRLCRFFLLLFFTSLQLFGLFFIHNNTVLFSRLGSFLPKNIIFLFGKKGCKYRFRFVSQSNQFLLQTIYQGQIFLCRAWGGRGWYKYIYKLDVRLDSHAFRVIRD